MNVLSEILPSPVIKAIGWTLLHSIWQGLTIALLLALLLICLQRSSAAIRYFMATGAMITFTIISLLTFVKEYRQASLLSLEETTYSPSTTRAMGLPIEFPLASTMKPITEKWSLAKLYPSFQEYFHQHLPLLVLLWSIGMTLLIIRFVGGYAYIQRLKNYKTVELPSNWQQTLKSLAIAAKITQPIKLVESALVKVPMVVGYLKPVILLPVGTVIGLPAEQVEAILAHELAHIYRKDYLVNIFQCIIEIIFFYHPGIWWISSRIREEREHCCDDLALSICGNTLTFAKALANLEQVARHIPALAMGFPGKGKQLLSRIKRLGNAQGRKPDFMEGFLAACFVMLSISAISVSAGIHKNTENKAFPVISLLEKEQQDPGKPALQFPSDTTINTFTFKGTRNGKRYHIEAIMDNGEIAELTVNGNTIPPADIPHYQELIFELMGTVPSPPSSATAVLSPTPITPLTPEPAQVPNPVHAPTITPSVRGHLAEPAITPPHPPMPALAPMAPEDIGYLIRAAFNGDTSRKMKGDFVYHFTGKKDKTYKITIKDGVLTELKVDGKKIPKDEYASYGYLVDEIETDVQVKELELQARQEERLARQREVLDQQIQQQHEKLEQLQRMQERDIEALNRKQEEIREQQIKAHEQALRQQEEAMERVREQQELAMKEHERAMAQHEESAKRSKELIEALNSELLKDKLIQKDKKHYIQISPTGLFIDSVKQPDQVFEKYRSLLEKKAGKPMDFTIQYYYNEDQNKDSSRKLKPMGSLIDKGLEKHQEAMKMHHELISLLNNYLVSKNILHGSQPFHIRISPEKLIINKVQQPDIVFNGYKEMIEARTRAAFVYTLEYDYQKNK